jgi:hypothetical protein
MNLIVLPWLLEVLGFIITLLWFSPTNNSTTLCGLNPHPSHVVLVIPLNNFQGGIILYEVNKLFNPHPQNRVCLELAPL